MISPIELGAGDLASGAVLSCLGVDAPGEVIVDDNLNAMRKNYNASCDLLYLRDTGCLNRLIVTQASLTDHRSSRVMFFNNQVLSPAR